MYVRSINALKTSFALTHFDNCVQSRMPFATFYSHTEKNRNELCMVISDLQNFIILLQCIRAMPFSTQFHFWPTLKILRFDEDSVREQNNFPFLCSCVSAWHYHFCERTVEHAFSCIYDCESKCSSDSLRIFVYFVTIWYYQVFTLKAQHTIHFE